jgi:hypothetical protein
MTTPSGNWRQQRELATLVAATLLLLLPFVSKPFHVDDPMYLWSAQHIRENPLDFYGFKVNWIEAAEPMAVINMNPPLFGFFLAGASLVAGWSEVALHLAMLIPAVAVVVATRRLSCRFAVPPLFSALALLSLPGFLVSATTLMPDVLTTAFWCWAVVLWIDGLDQDRIDLFAGAGLLAGACIVTKYVGLGLIPLFLVHGAVVRRRPGVWLAVPVVAVLIALAYGGYVHSLYGIDPFASASTYSLRMRGARGASFVDFLVGLAFLGGSAATVAFLMPWLWSRSQIAGFGGAALVLAIVLSSFSALLRDPFLPTAGWPLFVHFAVFVCLGVQIVGLLVRRLLRDRNADGVLLACWIIGIFVFSTFVNWTTNVRSLLPALPAVAMLLIGEAKATVPTPSAERRLLVPLALGAVVALVVAQADYALARTTRAAAEDLAALARSWNGPVRFRGTWGFQQYMESGGVRKIDAEDFQIEPGTLLVLPAIGLGVSSAPERKSHVEMDRGSYVVIGIRQYPLAGLASTFSPVRGSGFYGARSAPVPFVFLRAPAEQYFLLKIVRPIPLQHR